MITNVLVPIRRNKGIGLIKHEQKNVLSTEIKWFFYCSKNISLNSSWHGYIGTKWFQTLNYVFLVCHSSSSLNMNAHCMYDGLNDVYWGFPVKQKVTRFRWLTENKQRSCSSYVNSRYLIQCGINRRADLLRHYFMLKWRTKKSKKANKKCRDRLERISNLGRHHFIHNNDFTVLACWHVIDLETTTFVIERGRSQLPLREPCSHSKTIRLTCMGRYINNIIIAQFPYRITCTKECFLLPQAGTFPAHGKIQRQNTMKNSFHERIASNKISG